MDKIRLKQAENLIIKASDGTTSNIITEYKGEAVSDNEYKVYENTYRVVYFTKGIAPGKSVEWDIYKSLGPGVFDVQFRISTFDVETNAVCYGAIETVHIEVK